MKRIAAASCPSYGFFIAFAESGHRHHDAIGMFAGLLDVIGRIAEGAVVQAASIVQQARQSIEADGGAEKGSKVQRLHSHILHLSNMERNTVFRLMPGPAWGARTSCR